MIAYLLENNIRYNRYFFLDKRDLRKEDSEITVFQDKRSRLSLLVFYSYLLPSQIFIIIRLRIKLFIKKNHLFTPANIWQSHSNINLRLSSHHLISYCIKNRAQPIPKDTGNNDRIIYCLTSQQSPLTCTWQTGAKLIFQLINTPGAGK